MADGVNGAYDYVESGVSEGFDKAQKIVTGAGNNPSTWAGAFVIFALIGLSITRKSFRRFM
jgi:LPXTG-motif cell wall-anchored protein